MIQRILPIVLCLLFYNWSNGTHAIDGSGTITSQGIERSFLFHAPGDSVQGGLPLVLIFHGRGENAQMMKGYSNFDAAADDHGFLAVYPNATSIGGMPQWNAYVDEVTGHGGIDDFDATDDVIFMDDLIAHLCDTFGIDAGRIYATGNANGGFMAYRLAVQRPHVFAAVAPYAASLWGDLQYITGWFSQQFVPVGLMHIHGDADQVVPYPDQNHDPFAYIWPLSSYASNACNAFAYEVEEVNELVHRLVFCDGALPDTHKVEMVRLIGHGHDWPELPQYAMAHEIWDFLAWHEKEMPMFTCNIVGMEELIGTASFFSVHPNPATEILNFDRAMEPGTLLRIYDMQGSLLREMSGVVDRLPVLDLSPGFHVLEARTRDGEVLRARFIRE
jgi:poly(3-hydroxybutyrate) depolymerase